MQIDLSNKPYGSRFDADKQYTMALFHPSRELQAAELTEVQEMIGHSMSNFGDSLFEEGNVQSGMGYRIDEDVVDPLGGTHTTITIEDGYVYIGGKIRKFNEQTIEFNPEGEFNVQVRLEQTIVTSKEDSGLLDHSLGMPTYLSEGADRLKETVVLVANDSVGKDIYKFLDGGLTNQLQKPGMSRINDVLAERTFDESGSYVVEGLDITVEDSGKSNTVYEVVNPGRAYVKGHQITKVTPVKLEVPKSLGTRDVEGEVFYYDNVSRQGVLGNASVQSVSRVMAQVRVSRERVNRGAVRDSRDTLKNTPVVTVSRVWEEDSSNNVVKEYVQGVDYTLSGGRDINWSPSGSEPSSGSSYFVTYTYNDSMTENIDYKLETKLSGSEVVTVVDFNGMNGTIPINNTAVLVDYSYYLAREDLIVMNHNGDITVKQGEYSAFNKTIPPTHNDPFTLVLGSIKLFPNSEVGMVSSTSVKTVNMSEINKIISRVKNIEFNEALNALDENSILGADPSALRGIFSDSFIDLSRGDTGHPDYTVTHIPNHLAISTSTVDVDTPRLKINQDKSTVNVHGKFASAPSKEVLSIQQNVATETMNINPYKVFDAPAVVTLDPSSDSWVQELDDVTEIVDEYRYFLDSAHRRQLQDLEKLRQSTAEERAAYDFTPARMSKPTEYIKDILGLEFYDDGSTNFTEGRWVSKGLASSEHGVYRITSSIYEDFLIERGKEVVENAITHMRSIAVSFKGENFEPNADNIELIFDSKLVPITPKEGYYPGELPGTIKANSRGVVEGTFRIPQGVETGIVEVVLQHSDSNQAHTTFESTGIERYNKKITQKFDIVMTGSRTRHAGKTPQNQIYHSGFKAPSLYKADPLAQTFQFLSDRTISSMDLFFDRKDEVENVLVQIRDVPHSGMPGDIIYEEKVLSAQDIKTSEDGSVATRVNFNNPVQCEGGKQYAVVLMSNSDEYEMFIGTVGQDDLLSGEKVVTNPYGAGMLLSSANASAWTTHQSSDLKFRLYTSEYEGESVAYFDVIENIQANDITLLADYSNVDQTEIKFEFRVVGQSESEDTTLDSKEWIGIEDYSTSNLEDNIRLLEVRAVLKAKYNVSPLLRLDNLMLVFKKYGTEGTYVSRTVNSEDAPFNTIRVRLDAYSHPATSTVVKYSTDAGDTWKNFTVEPEVSNIGGGFHELFWEERIAEGNQSYDSIKYRIDLETSTNFVSPMARLLRTSTTME